MTEKRAQKIGFILVDGFSLMSLASATEPLRAANQLSGETLYDINFISAAGNHSESSIGIFSEGKSIAENDYDYDLVFSAAAGNPATYDNPDLLKYIEMLAAKRVNLGGRSGGPVVLASAGSQVKRRSTGQ